MPEIQVCTHQKLNMMQNPTAGTMTFLFAYNSEYNAYIQNMEARLVHLHIFPNFFLL